MPGWSKLFPDTSTVSWCFSIIWYITYPMQSSAKSGVHIYYQYAEYEHVTILHIGFGRAYYLSYSAYWLAYICKICKTLRKKIVTCLYSAYSAYWHMQNTSMPRYGFFIFCISLHIFFHILHIFLLFSCILLHIVFHILHIFKKYCEICPFVWCK